ncbi:hypothetical protein EDD85DRAFT_956443 [Armillaria nabsnona]|nr:hypothetical protein EDD85DRAFT_956443 [Armillaria nabsnona]
MPSQPAVLQSSFFKHKATSPTPDISRKKPKHHSITKKQTQFNNNVTNGLVMPDSEGESLEQYCNNSPILSPEDIIKQENLASQGFL